MWTLLGEQLLYWNRGLVFLSHQLHRLDEVIDLVEKKAKERGAERGQGML